MTFAVFHDFPSLENGPPKVDDFLVPVGTLILSRHPIGGVNPQT